MISVVYNVRVHLPLQQGLRLEADSTVNPPMLCASASSITTRIKTKDLTT